MANIEQGFAAFDAARLPAGRVNNAGRYRQLREDDRELEEYPSSELMKLPAFCNLLADVYVTSYCCNAGTYVMRGSSMPQISSGYSRGFAVRVGWASMRQPSIPFSERPAHRCDSPVRSTTRQSNNVSPSANRATPASAIIRFGFCRGRPLGRGTRNSPIVASAGEVPSS